MWRPQQEGIEELIILFKNSKSIDNSVHQQIYNVKKINLII
jgi:hypothetical protein